MTVIGVALVVRVFGMLADGSAQESMGLVRAESIMLVLFIADFFIERGRRNQISQAACLNEGGNWRPVDAVLSRH
jgi:hypothetical protein